MPLATEAGAGNTAAGASAVTTDRSRAGTPRNSDSDAHAVVEQVEIYILVHGLYPGLGGKLVPALRVGQNTRAKLARAESGSLQRHPAEPFARIG